MLRTAVAAVWCACAVAAPVDPLQKTGGSANGRLSPGKTDSYRLDVLAGQFARITADQRHLDLTLRILENGKTLTETDTFEQGEESISCIAERSAIWMVEVRAAATAATRGSYRIKLTDRRPSRPEDSHRIQAEAVSTQVRLLRRRGTSEALSVALEAADQALKLWEFLNEPGAALRARIEMADILHARNEYDKAREHYRLALALSSRLPDFRSEAEILNNLAMGYWQQGRTQEALEHLSRSWGVWRRMDISNGRGATLNNLGLLSWQTGQARAALGHYQEALRVLRATGHRRGVAYVQNNLALAYASLGEYGRSLDAFKQAIPMFLDTGDRLAAGRSWSAQGRVQLLRGDLRDAERSLARAVPLIEAAGDRRGLAEALNNQCRANLSADDPTAALAACGRALDLFRQIGDRRGEGLSLHNLGSVHAALGRREDAMSEFAEALRAYRDVGAREYEAAVLHVMGVTRRKAGAFDQARSLLENAIETVESLRAQAPGERLRASFLATRLDYYQDYIDLLLGMDEQRPDPALRITAFETSERARARSMVDLLREPQWDINQDADPELTRRGRRLQQQLSFLLERIGRSAGGGEEASRRQVDELLEELRLVDDRIREENPRAALLFSPPRPELEAIQAQLLDDDTALLEFSLGEPASYLFVVTKTALSTHRLSGRSDIETVAKTASDVLHRRQNPRTAMVRLSRLLLAPAVEDLKARRLLVVADGALHYIPFSALPHPVTGVPLLSTHEILSLPSATVVAAIRDNVSRRPGAPRLLGIVADPVYDGQDARIPAALRRGEASEDYQRLLFSRRAASRIASLAAPADRLLLMDFEAEKQKVLAGVLNPYRIVHFAVHGVVDEARPDLSGLVLSRAGADGSPRDGHLRLIEIYNLRLQADLVVLSACRTSLGREIRGEGLMTLTRAFFYAGAAAVIATLWPVDDEAAGELMEHFYQHLLGPRKPGPAAALRAAQLAIRAQPRWREPYYWAAHSLQGMEVPMR